MHVLLEIAFDFDVFEVEATRSRSTATSRTRRETALAYHATGPHFHSFSRCLDRLLTKLVVPLDPTNRQLAPVHVLELITTFDSLVVSFLDVLSVPLLPNLLVCRHILHHLVVHRQREAAQHQKEGEAVDETDPIGDLHCIHELA